MASIVTDGPSVPEYHAEIPENQNDYKFLEWYVWIDNISNNQAVQCQAQIEKNWKKKP